MTSADLTAYAYLWDGSEPGWRLNVVHRHEVRIVLQFGSTGPTAAEVAAMRDVFTELREQAAGDVWRELRGKQRVQLDAIYSLIERPRLLQAAGDRGLRAEALVSHSVSYVPYNEITKSALIIEDAVLGSAVGRRMTLEGVPVRETEVD